MDDLSHASQEMDGQSFTESGASYPLRLKFSLLKPYNSTWFGTNFEWVVCILSILYICNKFLAFSTKTLLLKPKICLLIRQKHQKISHVKVLPNVEIFSHSSRTDPLVWVFLLLLLLFRPYNAQQPKNFRSKEQLCSYLSLAGYSVAT